MPFGRRWPVLLIFLGSFIFATILLRSRIRPSSSNQALLYDGNPEPSKNDGRFNWARVKRHNRLHSLKPLPEIPRRPLLRIQHVFSEEEIKADRATSLERQAKVKEVFSKCWKSYQDKSWMKDELKPVSGRGEETFGGWSLTLVDSMDTLHIMGMKKEFREAVDSLHMIDFSNSTSQTLNVFEATVRMLGGFLSAYELSSDYRILEKVLELAEMLLLAFDTPNHMPLTRWRWDLRAQGGIQEAEPQVLLAEIGSLTMEFTRLSQITGDARWYDAVARITDMFYMQQASTKLPGMWPVTLNARDQITEDGGIFTMGGMADAFYECIPKSYALLGGAAPVYWKMYRGFTDVVTRLLLFRPMTARSDDILFVGNVQASDRGRTSFDPQIQHLTCFAGAMFAMGGRMFNIPGHVWIGKQLTEGCIWAHNATPSGLMPEVAHMVPCASRYNCPWDTKMWDKKILQTHSGLGVNDISNLIVDHKLPPGFTEIDDRRYLLRSEVIESIFVLYRITGDRTLLDKGWVIFEHILKHTETPYGHTSVSDVSDGKFPLRQEDRMESYWMAETLKYFYLLYSDPNTFSLDDYVFNSKGHPLKISKHGLL